MNNHQTPANFLGIDYGRKNCGLALSLGRVMPLGFSTVTGSQEEKIKQIAKVIRENKIEVVVIGMPFSSVHGEGQLTANRVFLSLLKKEVPSIILEEADETMTTKLVERYASQEKSHQEAARIILEDWMCKNDFLSSNIIA
jgi:RNase H-fold protein (predicted Holliday junction resolvase)